MKFETFIFITIYITLGIGYTQKYDDITATFIILNQNEKGHIQRATDLQAEIQMVTLSNETIEVFIATENFPKDAAWTYFPILKKLIERNARWYIFIEENTGVEVKSLISYLSGYDHRQSYFIGKRLSDRQPTIIHHFDSFIDEDTLYYPDLRAGFCLSNALIKKTAIAWNRSHKIIDFSIDPAYELSKFIYSLGVKLQQIPFFCIERKNNCLLWHLEFLPRGSADLNTIYFAVKTCRTLAAERISIIKDTWLLNAPRYQLYSDIKDSDLGTVDIGVPNTERGHCSKTFEIIRQVSLLEGLKWLAIVDDDTLINVHRLASFLSHYSPHEELALGERYGYMQSTNKGFSYVTGGGGIILSFPLVIHLSQAGVCSCPAADSPDDMVLGACLSRLKVPVIHSRRFHQARTDDYPTELLKDSKPISFHKFWMIDPRQTYKLWLQEKKHDEL